MLKKEYSKFEYLMAVVLHPEQDTTAGISYSKLKYFCP